MYLELSVLRAFVKGLKTGEVLWFVHENSSTVTEELEELFTSIRDKGQALIELFSWLAYFK